MSAATSVSPDSILLVTLDSCRFDTFLAARTPVLDQVSSLFEAQAPSHFTYGSHAAIFAGFTPGVPALAAPFLNPKFARLFRLDRAGHAGHGAAGFSLHGDDIVQGFRKAGYRTVGTGAAGWFDPATPVSRRLTGNFHDFYFAGHRGVRSQVDFIEKALKRNAGRNAFAFVNVGETHVPYHFEGAPWPQDDNPCVPFQHVDRAETCRTRQRLCCEHVDEALAPLIRTFAHATILVCADHGDCWGEDGLWEHGVSHPKTLTVPLLIRYRGRPVEAVVDLPHLAQCRLAG